MSDSSGQDLDVWGGECTNSPAVPTPGGAEPCPAKDADGNCPAGCRQCADFAEGNEFFRMERVGQGIP